VRYTEAPARREELLRRLTAQGYVSSAQLAIDLDVSEMTIRRDLRQLDYEGLARRVVGGASLPDWQGQGLPFEERDRIDSLEKRDIARACAEYLRDSTTVALDAGTTVAPLAGLVSAGTTLITHSAPVIAAVAERDDLDLIALGGTYQPATRSFAGPITGRNLELLSADVAVLSATAVTASGMLCANTLDAEIKRGMAAIAARTVLLVDHTKFGIRAPIRFGTLEMVDIVFTDPLTPPSDLDMLRAAGVQVIVAAPGTAGESA